MKTLWFIIALIAIFIAGTFIRDRLDTRPFKFENFKTSEELTLAVKSILNKDISYKNIMSLLEKSGAKCLILTKDTSRISVRGEYTHVIQCEYSSSLFSFNPLSHFKVILFTDHHNVLDFSAIKLKAFVI